MLHFLFTLTINYIFYRLKNEDKKYYLYQEIKINEKKILLKNYPEIDFYLFQIKKLKFIL